MPRGPATFRQRDIAAAIRAAKAAGESVMRVEVDRAGKIVIVLAPDGEPERGDNPWDGVLQ